jgi:hypothetical protein
MNRITVAEVVDAVERVMARKGAVERASLARPWQA